MNGVMERDMQIELGKLIEAIGCNRHETNLIHQAVATYGFNHDAIGVIRKTVRAEVARKIDWYIYAASLGAECEQVI